MDPTPAIDNKAVSYENAGGKWVVADRLWGVTIGAGSVQTTPSQLVAWAAQYWEPTIGAPTINEERLEGAVDAGQGMLYGAGIIQLDGGDDVGRMLWHNGSWGGLMSVFAVAPEHRAAVAVTCTSPSAARRLRRTLDVDIPRRVDRHRLTLARQPVTDDSGERTIGGWLRCA